MTGRTEQRAQTGSDDNVRVEKYDTDALRDAFPAWDDWPRETRVAYLRGQDTHPVSVEESSNVTCTALHEYYAMVLTLESDESEDLDPPHKLAFGDDASSFSTGDTAMNNEVGDRATITDVSATGTTTNIDEFVSSNQQNGNALAEIGVFSEDGEMYQHAPLSSTYQKDSSFALLINITITHSDI